MKLTQVLAISLMVFAATILSAGHVAAVGAVSLSIDSADSGVELRTHDMQDTQTYYILCSEDMTSWSYLRGAVTILGTNIYVETGGDSVVIVDGADSQTSIFINTEHQQRQFYKITQFPPLELEMVWVRVDDPGVPGHEGFTGEMSRYETTNAQYCEFLNAALASGDITVSDSIVYGASGPYDGQIYFRSYDIFSYYGKWSHIDYSGGSFSVRSLDGRDTNNNPVVYSMNNNPVIDVSWYGAMAFCDYYGYRLPTDWEWQAVADYDGSYTYGCGTTIDQSKANYWDGVLANPLGLFNRPATSPVNYYSSYGYGMNDMAGNVFEWTSTLSAQYTFIRGGSWSDTNQYCSVSHQVLYGSSGMHYYIGFRVCR